MKFVYCLIMRYMPKKSLIKILIITVVVFMLFYLMIFDCFIIVNTNGLPVIEAWSFLFLGLIAMFILYLLLVKNRIKQIRKEAKNVYLKIIKAILMYTVLLTIKSVIILVSSFFLMFSVQTNSYILKKNGNYYYEYFPSCMIPDSTYECYDSIETEDKNFYKVSKFLPFIGLPITAKEFNEIKDDAEVIFDECNH